MSVTAQSVGLYVSVPFCRAKCSFCNFASGIGSGEAMERYVVQLCEEVRGARQWANRQGVILPEQADTVYLGGGTPSLLEPHQMRAIFEAIRSEWTLTGDAEITMEAAPGQISEELLAEALRCGVNRISLGVQSFVDCEARAVGRSHTEASCLAEFDRLRREGVLNLGVDLIAGLPYQTEVSWNCSLEIAAAAKLDHLSVYMLEIDDESRLGREVLGGGARLHAPAVASEDLVTTLYEQACKFLPSAGLQQYEISNFAKPGMRSRHNGKYWTRAPYLGVGLDAHSMLSAPDGRALRWANPDEITSYPGPDSTRAAEWVSQREAFEETVFLGLRLLDGIPWAELSEFQSEWVTELAAAIRDLSAGGLIGSDNERFWLTQRGRVVSGEIFGELLAGVPA